MADKLPSNYTPEDIGDEIVFNQLRLDTLDRTSMDYDTDKAQIEHDLRELEQLLQPQSMERQHAWEQPHSKPRLAQSSQKHMYPSPGNEGLNEGSATQGAINWHGALPSNSTSPTTVSPQELHSFSAPTFRGQNYVANNWSFNGHTRPIGALSSPSTAVSASRKRGFDNLLNAQSPNIFGNKSRRTSPAPSADTTPGTPSSIDSLEQEERDFEKRHGSMFRRNSDMAFREQALQRQKIAAQRAEQLRKDEEMAKMIQAGQEAQSPYDSSQASNQSILNRDGTFRRPMLPRPVLNTPATPASQLRPDMFLTAGSAWQGLGAGSQSIPRLGGGIDAQRKSFFQAGSSTQSAPQHRVFKQDPTSISPWTSQAPRQSDYGTDDEDDDFSDIQEITPDAFNNRTSFKNQAYVPSSSMQRSMPGQWPATVKSDPLAQATGPFSGLQGYNGTVDLTSSSMSGNAGYGWSSAIGSTFVNGVRNVINSNPFSGTTGDDFDFLMDGYGPSTTQTSIGGSSVYGDPFNYPRLLGQAGSLPSSTSRFGPDVDSYYDSIRSDPVKTHEEIEKLLENIRPDEEIPPEEREPTPIQMTHELYPHQKLGLTWLKKMETGSNKGGILADDMGLGKTIQALALLVSRPSEEPRQKTTLIVAPVALLRQWKSEIEEKIKPRYALKVHIHHGSGKNGKKQSFRQLQEFDVVITTYGTLALEHKKKERWDEIKKAHPDALPGAKEKLALLADECKWYRVILDEAQCIKNKDTKGARAACQLQSTYRFCMTGTPMMNNIGELYSLIHFLRIRPYSEWTRFNTDIWQPVKANNYRREGAMMKLQALTKALMLRRNKQSEIDGEKILKNLPPRTTEIDKPEFSTDERDFYDALEGKMQLRFNRYLEAGTATRNYANVLVLLLRLRQACCHPHLIKDFAVSANAEVSVDDMRELAKAFAPDVIRRIKGKVADVRKEITETEGNGPESSEVAFSCPVCYESSENPAIFFPCGHDTCAECFGKITDPQRAIAEGSAEGEYKCPECRSKVEASKVIDLNTFKQVHMPEELKDKHVLDKAAIDHDDSDDDNDSDSDSDDEDSETGSLEDFIVDDADTDGEPSSRKSKKSKAKPGKKGTSSKSKGKGKEKESSKARTLADLKREGMRNKKAKKKYLRRLRRDFVSSAKIEKTMALLQEIHDNDPTEKTIIFSQFTSLLDLLEIPISDKYRSYERYDGSMGATARADAVSHFMTDEDCKLMLISLKAGNAGLNLTRASQVIVLDPFWNPYIEDQAVDRAHRIGQLREVKVHRILIENTVEDRICQLQDKKREMIQTALDENDGKSISRLGLTELKFLFGLGRNPNTR